MGNVNPESGLQKVRGYLENELGSLPFKGSASEVPINPLIAYDIGVPISAVKAAVAYLRTIGLLPRPTSREDTITRLSKSKSFDPQLEEECRWIAEYYGIRMAPREIHHALLFERGVDISTHNITARMYRKRKIGQLDKRSEEDNQNIRSTTLNPTEEQIKGRVRLWLDLRRVLVEDRKPLPGTRKEWIALLAEPIPVLAGRKIKIKGGQLGVIEGQIERDGITLIKIRLLMGVEEVPSSNGEKNREAIRFGDGAFKFIPKDMFRERVELAPPDETN